MFKIDNPLMKILTRIGNMILVSMYWLATCIPVVTIVPACAALFHTTTKVIRGDGEGVTADFFHSFKQSLKPGILLSVIVAGVSFVVYTCVDFGHQMMSRNAAGTAYFAVGCVLAAIWIATVLYLAPALSRFEGSVMDILRIAFYLPFHHVAGVLVQVVLLAVMVFAVNYYPIFLLIVPALYTDLTCGMVDKAMKKLEEKNGNTKSAEPAGIAARTKVAAGTSPLETSAPSEEAALSERSQMQELSALEQAAYMDEEKI